MSFDAQALYQLLPNIHRLRDAERGYPLRQLVEVIAGQFAVLEDEIERLHENQFVETAEPWALPYLGDLLAISGLPASNLAHTPRAEVGNTLAYRRRKGTAAVLELLARDTTGWPARAVEFFQRIEATQLLNHLRPNAHATANLRQASQLEFVNGPFEPLSRLAEVRRIQPARGRWNIPNVGVFLWRIPACALTQSPLVPCSILKDGRHFRFHPLGLDAPLFNLPSTETDAGTLASPDNVPFPLSPRRLAGRRWPAPHPADPPQFHPSTAYYGRGKTLLLLEGSGTEYTPVPYDRILVADLRDIPGNKWGHEDFSTATNNLILLDPQRGRVVFPSVPNHPPKATFHLGAALPIGGGEYSRSQSLGASQPNATKIRSTPPSADIIANSIPALPTPPNPPPPVSLAITDSGRYHESNLVLDATNRSIRIAAEDGHSPTVWLTQGVNVKGNSNGEVILDGLRFVGGPLFVEAQESVRRLVLRHVTIIPTPTPLLPDGSNAFNGTVALTISAPNVEVLIEDCILGPICLAQDTRLTLRRSIVHAGDPSHPAICAFLPSPPPNPAPSPAAGTLRIDRSTIIGKIAAHDFDLVSNSILLAKLAPADLPAAWPAPVWTPRRQTGCFRFSWLPTQSLVPKRHQCLPTNSHPLAVPCFTSLALGHPAFGQLSRLGPDSIRSGADDGSAMGASHDLFEPQREAHLRTRLNEYLPFGLETGTLFPS